jgi:hypothetical protein
MKYEIVLQWPASSIDDYDDMISVEDALIDGLTDDAEVDGHDGGAGQVNIFIRADNPPKIFENVKIILAACDAWAEVRVAYRDIEEAEYVILWPEDLKEFEVL